MPWVVRVMTERRSHWDIDLVEGVGRRLIPRYRSIGYCTDAERHRIYTLIEFVEDWQDARGDAIDGRSLTEAIFAVQRVRELHGRHDPNCPYGEDCAGAGLCLACREEYPCATIRALGGDSDA